MRLFALNHKPYTKLRILLIPIIFYLFPLMVSASALPMPAQTLYIKRTTPLARFVHQVWKMNPAIQSARADLASVNADFAQRRRPIYNPSVNLAAQHVRNLPEEDFYTAGISQTVDLFNKRAARMQVGQYSVAEAKANLANLQLSLASETLKALAEYRIMKKVIKLAKRRTDLLRQFKNQNARKFKSGDIAQDALDLSTLAFAEAISQQADAEVKLIQAKQRLMAITQISSKRWPSLPYKLPTPLRLGGNRQEHLLRRLPIMHLYNAKVAVAKSAIRVAKTRAKADPTLSVQSGVQDKEFLIMGGISFPLFVRNTFKDQVRAASHQAIAAEQAQINGYQEAKAALQSSIIRYKILYLSTQRWHKVSKRSLGGGMKLLNRLWSAGELSTTDYLVQLKQRIDSQIAGVELKGKAWQMWFTLMQSSGQINAQLTET